MNLREYFEKYRDLTFELMNEVRGNSPNNQLEILINKREEVLELIKAHNFDEEEIRTIGNSLNLLELEEELKNVIRKEEIKTKKEIESLKRAKQANNQYNSIENRSRVFNKSV